MKKTIRISLLVFAILVMLGVTGAAQKSAPKEVQNSSYKIGQIWSYKTRVNEPNSTFTVVKIDSDPRFGNIIHIAVRNLKMKNPRSPDGISDVINHMPFSEKAVAQSAIKLLKEKADLPDFEEGYSLWKEAFDQKRAGFYTISIAEAVKIAEDNLNR